MLDALKQLLGGATAAIANLKRSGAGIRERLDELAREEIALLSDPAPLDALGANLEEYVARCRRQWIAANGLTVVHGASGRVARSLGAADQRPAVVPPQLEDVLPGVVTLDLLAGLFPSLLLEGLRQAVKDTEYTPGPAMATRVARLAAIEKERETLQRRHAALVDEAEAAGVHLQHLPEEVGRRTQAAQARERWELDQRANAGYYRRNPGARPPEPEVAP